ncbi:hypothetical protein SAMN06265364_103132 [Prevotella jejuni]|uniref:Uncharacterized protein n=1 Tax=Prevotella jejuni TaxID=1177574 RepID=A0AA94ISZ0_9BACT|nr:hypothetical protein SAMN06265364_103132 [Prevotella jejuni]
MGAKVMFFRLMPKFYCIILRLNVV